MLQHNMLLGAKPRGEWAGLTEICPHEISRRCLRSRQRIQFLAIIISAESDDGVIVRGAEREQVSLLVQVRGQRRVHGRAGDALCDARAASRTFMQLQITAPYRRHGDF